MKHAKHWYAFFVFVALTFSLQGCLGIGGSSNTPGQNFQKTSSGNGPAIGINNTDQAVFQGKIYFTLDRNLYYLDGKRQLHQLTHGLDVRDPAVSPNGQWIAFVIRHNDKNYADLAYMASGGGPIKILLSGVGTYIANPGYPAPKSTHTWFAQPAWAPDNSHLLFLSDLQKAFWDARSLGVNAFLLDMQVFEISINDANLTPNPDHIKAVAYAAYGDGGNRDPNFRPGHPDQIVYTHFAYDTTQTKQVIQIYLENPDMIANNPNKGYHPGVFPFDPSVALTPGTPDLTNMEPEFSPDGNFIAYVRRLDANHMGIYIMPVAEGVTSNPNSDAIKKQALVPYNKSSLVFSSQYVSQPIWSPDGKQMAYLTYNNNVYDIWLATLQVDPKTGAYSMKGSPVQLTDTGGHLDADSRPFWTN